MRKFFAFLALSVAVLSANGQARLYDEMCDPLQAVFCDYIESSSSQNVLSEGGGLRIVLTGVFQPVNSLSAKLKADARVPHRRFSIYML